MQNPTKIRAAKPALNKVVDIESTVIYRPRTPDVLRKINPMLSWNKAFLLFIEYD